jgi:hypothetical protein
MLSDIYLIYKVYQVQWHLARIAITALVQTWVSEVLHCFCDVQIPIYSKKHVAPHPKIASICMHDPDHKKSMNPTSKRGS